MEAERELQAKVEDPEVLEVQYPEAAKPEDKYVNTRGATLNYVLWRKAREVYCADKNSPGDL
ncbi:MAG: hypothetical protein ACRDKF_16540 [Actinomycetota bacterium]